MDSINHSHRGFYSNYRLVNPRRFFYPYSVESLNIYGYETVFPKDFGMACKLAKG